MSMGTVNASQVRALGRFASAQTVSDVIALALEEAPAITYGNAVGVYLFERGGVDVHSIGASEQAISKYLSLPPGSDMLVARMQEINLPVHEQSIFAPDEWRSQPLYECVAGPFGFEHYLVAPLIGRGEIVGALTLARGKGEPAFTQADLTATAMTTAYLSVALAYSRQCETSILVSLSQLTEREKQISVFVAKGLGNLEVARELGISENTVKKHLKSVFSKLGVSRRTELAWLATLGGLA